jgi:hypothetical protein
MRFQYIINHFPSGMLRRMALVRTDVSEELNVLHQGDKNR